MLRGLRFGLWGRLVTCAPIANRIANQRKKRVKQPAAGYHPGHHPAPQRRTLKRAWRACGLALQRQPILNRAAQPSQAPAWRAVAR